METMNYYLKKLIKQNEEIMKKLEKHEKTIARLDRTLKRRDKKKESENVKENLINAMSPHGMFDFKQISLQNRLSSHIKSMIAKEPDSCTHKNFVLRYTYEFFKIPINNSFKIQNTYHKIYGKKWHTISPKLFYKTIFDTIWFHYTSYINDILEEPGWFQNNFTTCENPLERIDIEKILHSL